ncbi:MAG TPA: spore cortex biosynthesis protein YabQ [Firmicutes bacterium]|nr:spore cortex biosynthesis protein YabQ [Bacillota bacterium]
MESLSTQLYAFGIVMLAGISLGVLFDFFRVIRGLLRPGFFATPLLDLLFWVICTPVLILYLLLANWGELRGYVAIALVLGFAFYKLFLGGIVLTLLLLVVRGVSNLLSLIITFVLWLIAFPVRLLARISLGLPRLRLPDWRWKPRLRWRK